MTDLIELLQLGERLESTGVEWRGRNFEDVYSELHARDRDSAALRELEDSVRDYFAALRLPASATIYDYLVLTLREKDVIATFNWDPFLVQAVHRNRAVKRCPHLLFLHGCAALASCSDCQRTDFNGSRCGGCGKPMDPNRLLFPVANKDYTTDPFIAANWQTLREVLSEAYFLTIFGYSAPISDAGAVEIMKQAWAVNHTRTLSEIEIIDVKSEEELKKTWDPFITRQHFSCTASFDKNYLAWHPRRSCEALAYATLQNDPWPDDWIPSLESPVEIQDWVSGLVRQEVELDVDGVCLPRDGSKAADSQQRKSESR